MCGYTNKGPLPKGGLLIDGGTADILIRDDKFAKTLKGLAAPTRITLQAGCHTLIHTTHLIYAVHHEIDWFLEYSRPELKSDSATSTGPPHKCPSSRCTILEVVFSLDTTRVNEKFTLDVGVVIGAEIAAAICAREAQTGADRAAEFFDLSRMKWNVLAL
ncbi:MAG: hypothetical protein VCB07_00760 [Gammaproteobacteria bacterium]